jgi:hypothetical protein
MIWPRMGSCEHSNEPESIKFWEILEYLGELRGVSTKKV